MASTTYDDEQVACTNSEIVIKRYYFPRGGDKHVPYSAIRGVTRLELKGLSAVRRWRLWGSGDIVHWWNYDPKRPRKSVALVLDLGGLVRPTITPDDPDAVERLIDRQRNA